MEFEGSKDGDDGSQRSEVGGQRSDVCVWEAAGTIEEGSDGPQGRGYRGEEGIYMREEGAGARDSCDLADESWVLAVEESEAAAREVGRVLSSRTGGARRIRR